MRKDRLGPLARKAAEIEHQRVLKDFNRFSYDYVEAYKADKNVKNLPVKESKAQQQMKLNEFIKPSTVAHFSREERLSKRLARMGVASRRMAEKLIAQGMVKVDSAVVDSNVPVTDESHIQVGAKTGMYTPVKENTRIWLFNNPRHMVTTHFDP